MARRKHKKRVHAKRRHSRSHMGAVDMTGTLAVVAGAVAAKYLNKVIPSTVNPTISAGGKIAVGLLLPMLSKSGTTKNMLSSAGAGMAAVGGLELLTNMGVLSGMADDDMLAVSVNGVWNGGDISVLSGADDINVINGAEVETSVLGADEVETSVLGADDDLGAVEMEEL